MYHHHKGRSLDELPPTSHATRAHILRAFFATNIMITLLDYQPSVLDPRVYGFAVEDALLVPDVGLHPIPEEYSLFSMCGKCSTVRCTVERMAYLAVRFAIVKSILQMALTARTHLVASIELTFCDIV